MYVLNCFYEECWLCLSLIKCLTDFKAFHTSTKKGVDCSRFLDWGMRHTTHPTFTADVLSITPWSDLTSLSPINLFRFHLFTTLLLSSNFPTLLLIYLSPRNVMLAPLWRIASTRKAQWDLTNHRYLVMSSLKVLLHLIHLLLSLYMVKVITFEC